MISSKKLAEAFEELSEEVRELSLGSEIPRLPSPPDPLEFYREFVSKNRPCIISSAIDDWPALEKWNNAYLIQKVGDSKVSVALTPDGRGDAVVDLTKLRDALTIKGVSFECDLQSTCESHKASKDAKKTASGTTEKQSMSPTKKIENEYFAMPLEQKMTVSQFLDLLELSRTHIELGVPYAQHQNGSFLTEFSSLIEDATIDISWASKAFGCLPEAVNLWIGDDRSVSSFHKDHYENIYAVVSGEKYFTLLPPVDLSRLYIQSYPAASYSQDGNVFSLLPETPPSSVPWSPVDPYPHPEEKSLMEDRFPLYFKGPPPFCCTLKAGEVLYLPSMWFHHVRQSQDDEGRTIALNFWYDMQFDVKYAYFNFLKTVVETSQKKLVSTELAKPQVGSED